jgi:hypothetical protein
MNWLWQTPDGLVIATSCLGFVLFLSVHVTLFRLLPVNASAKMMLFAIGSGELFSVGVLIGAAWGCEWNAFIFTGTLVIATLAIYNLFIYHYICWVYGVGEAAIRIRLLRTIYGCPSHQATIHQIYDDYDGEKVLQMRLGRLGRSNHIRVAGDGYTSGSFLLIWQNTILKTFRKALGINLHDATLVRDG